jgi:asparagine synthase (glutamine-hydrolysing)
MCGIAGAYGWVNDDALGEMISCLRHRGPDDDGTFVDRDASIMMGMRRLSIVDLEGGAQPIANEDGSVRVVFNGEIYNHESLRDDLESKDHRLSTQSDTEVLVHLWEEHGERMPELLNGMFAFAIWDADQECVFLARDRLGIKPLYYANLGDRFVWGSEIQSILATGVDRTLDEAAVYNYFSLHYSPWPQTLFRSVNKLEPGTSICVDRSGVSHRRYWNFSPDQVKGSRDAVADRLLDHLRTSVDRRMMADVPVGAFLSGGLDSSTVVGLMSELREDIQTFSVAFTDEANDESEEARFVAEEFGTDHHELLVDLNHADVFGDAVRHYGEPLPDPAVLPTMALAERAREHVKVVQTGSGADELFAGYWMHRSIPRHRQLAGWLPDSVSQLIGALTEYAPESYRPHVRYAASLGSDTDAVLGAARRFRELPVEEYLTTNQTPETSGMVEMVETAFSRVSDDRTKRILSFYLHYWLPDDILYKIDRATMSASLEARVPFLDHELVEFVYGVPSNYLTEDGSYKPLLKRAVRDIVPSRTLNRSKQGFGIQQTEWLRHDHDAITQWLSEDRLGKVPYLNTTVVHDLWDAHRHNRADHGVTLWKILNYVAWYHEFCAGQSSART